MVNYNIVLTKQGTKDAQKLKSAGLKNKTLQLFEILKKNPYQPPYEKLVGDLKGYYSRRINIHHRLVYQVIEDKKIVKIIRMWTHYDGL